MAGTTASQNIWIYDKITGGTFCNTLAFLKGEEAAGRLPRYMIYYVHPDPLSVSMVTPSTILVGNDTIGLTMTDEDGRTADCVSLGGVLIVKEFDPVHISVDLPGNCRNHYSVDSIFGGKTLCRKIVAYSIYNTTEWSAVGPPNMITDTFYVILT